MLKFFDNKGRRVPGKDARTFADSPSFYYKLSQPEIDYALVLERAKRFNHIPASVTANEFRSKAETLLKIIQADDAYANLLQGVKIPFVTMRKSHAADLGEELKGDLLPGLQDSFSASFPDAHFKAVLQSNSELPGNISLAASSRYQDFVSAAEAGPVVGWYFPQALQEFDTQSQRSQMLSLPVLPRAKVCLSGGIDIFAAVTGFPDLLISDEFYTPILCMSAYVHADPRLVLLLKAYGPHMEFWCMTQMLTKDTTQVSEQWAGGITVFSNTK